MIQLTPATIMMLTGGLLLIALGSSALTWLIADHCTVTRWRRRAHHAEEQLARLRAQRRQRRQPSTRRPEPLLVPPGLFAEADRVLSADAPTVVMRAATPDALRLANQMGRRAGQ